MISHHGEKTVHQFLKCLTIRHPITFGKKVMDKTTTDSEEKWPNLEVNGHVTNLVREHLEKTILVLLRFLLTGNKYTTIEDDAITAMRGIVSDKIIDTRLQTVSDIMALDKNSIDAVYRLICAKDDYWPRNRMPLALVPVVRAIVGWLYEQITQCHPDSPVYLPVLTKETQDLRNIFVAQSTVWAVDIWALRLRSYSPRQAMCLLSLLSEPLPDCEFTFTPTLVTPYPATQIGVLCPRQLTRYLYPANRIVPGLTRRWSETFDRYRIGLDIY